ncbi:hypothetical protein JCM11641_004490 [Rhodosporidiobolus odoratus]
MTLRLCVSYARIYTRDTLLYRVLVALCALVAAGQSASVCASVFQFISFDPTKPAESFDKHRSIILAIETCTVATTVISQAFFVARLFSLTRDCRIRVPSLLLWLASTAVLLVWAVWQTQKTTPMPTIRADRLGKVAIICSWLLFVAAAFVSVSSMYLLPRARPLEDGEQLSHTLPSRLFRLLCFSCETSFLLALLLLFNAICRCLALHFPSATLVAAFSFYLYPPLSAFSVLFALNQRPPPPLPPSLGSGLSCFSCSKAMGWTSGRGSSNPVDSKSGRPDMATTGAAVGTGGKAEISSATGRGSGEITYDPDDPQTWRGDAQRLYPSIRFETGADDVAPFSQDGSIGGRSTFSARSVRARSPARGEAGGGSAPRLGRRSTEETGVVSLASFGVTSGQVYDEGSVEDDPTVLSLDLNALRDVEARQWGPRGKREMVLQSDEPEEIYEDPDFLPHCPDSSCPSSPTFPV